MTTTNSATAQLMGLGSRFSTEAKEAVEAFSDGLAGTVPSAQSCRSMILADDRGLAAYIRSASGEWQLVSQLQGETADEIAALVSRLPVGRVLLRTGSGRAVVTKLQLPAATLDVLTQVVRNKVESLAPWPLQEVLCGHRLAGSPQNGQILVDVGIVSRKSVTDLLTRLAAAGVQIARFETGHGDETIDGIEIDVHGEVRRAAMRRRVKSVMLLVLGAVALVGGVGAYLSYQTASEISETEAGIARLQQVLRNNGDTGGASLKLAQANILYARKRETRPTIELLNTLTKLVPDGIWLSTLDLDGKTLTIAGRGNEVPGVIATLESSDTFTDVNFASATQREADAAADSFSISAVVEEKAPSP
jgi:general secretion pathway protein L